MNRVRWPFFIGRGNPCVTVKKETPKFEKRIILAHNSPCKLHSVQRKFAQWHPAILKLCANIMKIVLRGLKRQTYKYHLKKMFITGKSYALENIVIFAKSPFFYAYIFFSFDIKYCQSLSFWLTCKTAQRRYFVSAYSSFWPDFYLVWLRKVFSSFALLVLLFNRQFENIIDKKKTRCASF